MESIERIVAQYEKWTDEELLEELTKWRSSNSGEAVGCVMVFEAVARARGLV